MHGVLWHEEPNRSVGIRRGEHVSEERGGKDRILKTHSCDDINPGEIFRYKRHLSVLVLGVPLWL